MLSAKNTNRYPRNISMCRHLILRIW